MDLPSFIPIFPLPNVVLFPEVPLPLHIFEPRYRAMVRDALAGLGADRHGVAARRLGGRSTMPRPRSTGSAAPARSSRRRHCRTASSTSCSPGCSEFEIVSEQRERLYRQASVVWRDRAPGGGPAEGSARGARPRHRAAYSVAPADDDRAQLLGDAALSDATLVNFFAFWFELSPIEKQCLLEERGGCPRAAACSRSSSSGSTRRNAATPTSVCAGCTERDPRHVVPPRSAPSPRRGEAAVLPRPHAESALSVAPLAALPAPRSRCGCWSRRDTPTASPTGCEYRADLYDGRQG